MLLPFNAAAWCGHTQESREWAEDIQSAFDAMQPRLKIESAALTMGLDREDLSKQLSGVKPLNLWRLTALPLEFHVLLFKARAARIGGAFLTADDIALIKGFVGMGSRAAKMMLPEEQERRRA